MPKKRLLIDKEAVKRSAGKCQFCDNDQYATLDVHRIVPGCEGGRYTPDNVVVLCASCHRLVHDGAYEIDRWYLSSNGSRMLRVVITQTKEEKFF